MILPRLAYTKHVLSKRRSKDIFRLVQRQSFSYIDIFEKQRSSFIKEFAVTHTPANGELLHFDDERHFLEALTRWNYFPNQKASATELPPNICTRRFTPEVVRELLKQLKINTPRRKIGFDVIEYRATRYNNVSRVLGLIHPLAFAQIFDVFESNRIELQNAMNDDNSAIRVNTHNDGRMLIMNYEDHETKVLAAAGQSFGKRFRAHADVANCFGSFYTHSLEWAIQGFEVAKAGLVKGAPSHWSSNLDRTLRAAKRNETSGLPIGPATSSIAVEIILADVDRKLRGRFSFVRYVDDYTALCSSYEEAQEFVRLLGKELSQYRLTLNISKTSIVELPEPLQEKWVYELMNAVPQLKLSDGQLTSLSTREAFQFLDHAVRLNNETPDGSVVKFAVAAIAGFLNDKTAADVFHYVLNLAWHYPILLPYLEKIDARHVYYDKEQLINRLNEIIEVNALHRRSDGICWALYYLERLEAEPSDKSINGIMESKDCIAIAMLSRFKVAVDLVTQYAKELIDKHLYTKDQNWLLLYQLFLADKIPNPYEEDETFLLLKRYEVDFFCPVGERSRAEEYCSLIANPFLEAGDIPSFEEWMEGAK